MPYQKIEGYTGNMYGDNRRVSNDAMLQSKLPLEDYVTNLPKPQPTQHAEGYGYGLPPLPSSASPMAGSVTVTVEPESVQYPNIPPEYEGMRIVESYTPSADLPQTQGEPSFKDSFDLIEGVDGNVTVTTTNLHPVVILVVLLLLYFALKYWGDALDGWLTVTFFAGQTPSWKASVIMAVIFSVIIIGVLLIFNITVPVLTRELSLS